MQFEGAEFSLKEKFIDLYKRKRVNWGPLGTFVFNRTYARELEDGTNERWWQTVRRVVEGCYLIQKRHCKQQFVLWDERQAQKSAQAMYDAIFTFKFLPPGRGLWAMGTEFLFKQGGACVNNCAFMSTEDLAHDFSGPFVWLAEMSMLGVGVGFDCEGAFGREILLRAPRVAIGESFVVEDSRQGWVAAFRRVLDSFVGKDTLPESFDYSAIRPAGSPIKGFGGVAPGPEPLQKLVDRTRIILDEYVKEDKPVDSRLIVDVMNFAGAAVVAGGVRRSAELALGRPDDLEYIGLKDQGRVEDPTLARWASNNSVIVKQGSSYEALASRSVENGEPGYFWLDNARAYGRLADGPTNADRRVRGGNPCLEQTLESRELCCLVETFPSLHSCLEEYKQTLKFAYLYAKTVTLIPTHDPRTNAVMFRNRRIGLSQTGIVENINRIGLREHLRWCDEGYKEVRRWDDVYSDWMCIPRSIKVTTVKPSGTVSLLPGVTPGIHSPHSEHYIRRIRVSKNSDVWQHYQKAGYEVVQDVYADNTMVIEFPVKENNFTRGKDDVSMWEQFALAAALQRHWSDNAVSITITIQPNEAKDLASALTVYESQLKSVSFLPVRGDQVYQQAPYESITAEQYKERTSSLKPVNFDAIADIDKKEERFCDGEVCTL